MLMTSCFVCATLNLGRKKSTGTEPNCFVYPLMFMNVQAEYKDLCVRHEYEFCIHLHYIYFPLFFWKIR